LLLLEMYWDSVHSMLFRHHVAIALVQFKIIVSLPRKIPVMCSRAQTDLFLCGCLNPVVWLTYLINP